MRIKFSRNYEETEWLEGDELVTRKTWAATSNVAITTNKPSEVPEVDKVIEHIEAHTDWQAHWCPSTTPEAMQSFYDLYGDWTDEYDNGFDIPHEDVAEFKEAYFAAKKAVKEGWPWRTRVTA